MLYLFLILVSGQWDLREILGEDDIIIYCQFYRTPCQNPTTFPVPRRSSSGIIYKTWQKPDVDNLCPEDLCGPFCNSTEPSCFIDYRIPKNPEDKTLGGRSLSSASGTTDQVGYMNETYCPPNCCTDSNCRRYRDITGEPVPINHEIFLVFGGTALRNVTVDGKSLFNNCNLESIKTARLYYPLEVSESCGIENLNEIWRYDISDNKWTYIEPTYPPYVANYSFPFPRHSHAAVLVEMTRFEDSLNLEIFQKFMYIYGGFALECRDACDDMWRFEIPWAAQEYYPRPSGGFWNRAGYWEELHQNYSPGRRMFHKMVVSDDYKYIYLYGGLRNSTLFNDMWRYDTKLDIWEELIFYGIEKVTRSVTTWNETVYDIELNITDMRLGDTILYSKKGSVPEPRMSHCLLYFNSTSDYIFLFGGLGTRVRVFELGNASIALDDFWVFSLSSQKWTRIYSDTSGPSARFEANIIQVDETRLAVYGGRHNEDVFDDFWVYNIETNHWYNWTEILKSGSKYPSGRYKGILLRTEQGMIMYSGSYTNATNLTESDLTTEDYMTYVAECQDVLDLYGVSIYEIGTEAFAERQAELYQETGSNCFLKTTPLPTFSGNIEYLQGVWFFNLTNCEANCNDRGYCEFGTCYCQPGYYGKLCEEVACPGSFCIYDNEFFSTAECVHCSGYGDCNNGTCTCQKGHSGDDCSKSTCIDNCNYHGTCVEMYPISQCDCYGKYGGDTCQVVLCLNSCNPPHGNCNTTTGECTCELGYFGIDCSVIGLGGSGDLVVYLAVELLILCY